MYYLMWRVLTGQHQQITLSFLPVGHTKFFPDAGFGMLKRKFKHTKVGCLDDIASVVENSAAMNHAQLVGNQQGNVIVPSYDWITFFEENIIKNALRGIKKMAHFRFSSDSPGYVHVKNRSDDTTERKIKLVKDISWQPSVQSLPDIIAPDGLPLKRQWYLYEKIREFCPEHCKDLVCPLPRKRPSPSDDESPEDEWHVHTYIYYHTSFSIYFIYNPLYTNASMITHNCTTHHAYTYINNLFEHNEPTQTGKKERSVKTITTALF